ENIDCCGLAMDKYGFLYVSDCVKNEVRRWKMEEYNNEGIVVAGGNGKGNQLNQLDFPNFIFVDEDQSVYVSDSSNHRVMKWRKEVKEGRIIAGGNDFENDRVMRWCEEKEEGEIVVGGNGRGYQYNQLNGPIGLSFDDEGKLYVVDNLNHRIQKFEIIF
ncbi:unnamed protein product, partial [Adineta steineri]